MICKECKKEIPEGKEKVWIRLRDGYPMLCEDCHERTIETIQAHGGVQPSATECDGGDKMSEINNPMRLHYVNPAGELTEANLIEVTRWLAEKYPNVTLGFPGTEERYKNTLDEIYGNTTEENVRNLAWHALNGTMDTKQAAQAAKEA